MGQQQCQVQSRTRISLRLNKYYDADLIQYLDGAKNMSRELRRIIRAGLKVLNNNKGKVVTIHGQKR